jgi:hypothetical protein
MNTRKSLFAICLLASVCLMSACRLTNPTLRNWGPMTDTNPPSAVQYAVADAGYNEEIHFKNNGAAPVKFTFVASFTGETHKGEGVIHLDAGATGGEQVLGKRAIPDSVTVNIQQQ